MVVVGWVCCAVLCALNVRAKLLEETVVIINGRAFVLLSPVTYGYESDSDTLGV